MKRELHIVLYESNDNRIISSYNGTKAVLDYVRDKILGGYRTRDVKSIYTSQIVFADTRYIELGLDLYLHINRGENPIHLELDKPLLPYSERILKSTTNIYNLILSGEFDKKKK